jgi:hypothetical protein
MDNRMQLLHGTPEYIIANAAMREASGGSPILPFAGITDPNEALKHAEHLVSLAAIQDIREAARAAMINLRNYKDMPDDELKAAIRYIIRTSEDEAEIRTRIRETLGYPGEVSLQFVEATDSQSRTALALVRAMGGLHTLRQAMVTGSLLGHNGPITF